MSDNNKNNFMNESSAHVSNINRVLKNIKLDVMVNFIHSDAAGIIVVTNKVAASLDLQSISLLYLQENTNNPINSNIVENILKDNHIFNNIMLASKPCVIKVSPKSDIVIVWICYNLSLYIK